MKKLMAILSIALIATLTATSMEATVVSTKGKAEVQKGNSWSTLSVGNSLKKGDVIQTGFKSEVILKIKNSTVTVAPLSRITIEQLAEKNDADNTRLFLDTGSLKSDVKKTEDRRVGFTVRSPVATASVRGTVMSVTNAFRSTQVRGFEGSVSTWKSSGTQSAEVATDDGAVSGSEADAGAVLVKKNMTSSFTANSSTSPMENAAKQSVDIGGAKTPATQVAEVSLGSGGRGAKKASVIVKINLGN